MQSHLDVSRPASDDLGASFERHRVEIEHYLRVCGCSADEAEDLAQEVFLVVLRKRPRFEDEREARAYLRRAARYLFLGAWRRRGPRPLAWLDAVDTSFEETADRPYADWLDALRACSDELTGRARAAVELFYMQSRPRAEVARRLGMRESGVKTLLQRVRRRLRACVERNTR